MYWRPFTSYTAGIPSGRAGRTRSHSTAPVCLVERAHGPIAVGPDEQQAAGRRDQPVAVDALAFPVSRIPRAASSGTVPMGTAHLIVPLLFRS